MTPERLKEIEARVTKVTALAWVVSGRKILADDERATVVVHEMGGSMSNPSVAADADLIAHAPADLRELLDYCRELEAVVGRLPMTADGVRVVPLTGKVWYPGRADDDGEALAAQWVEEWGWFEGFIVAASIDEDDCPYMMSPRGKRVWEAVRVEDCYSTKAAALAAQKAGA